MKDQDKTKEQLIDELAEMRQKIVKLEALDTEQNKEREDLNKNEIRWHSILQSIPSFVAEIDLDGKVLSLNKVQSGFSLEDFVGKSVYDFTPPEVLEILKSAIAEVIEKGKQVEYIAPDYGPNRTPAWYEHIVVPVMEGGEIRSLIMIVSDITERKQAEEALKTSEEKYRTIFEQAADSIMLVDGETGELVEFNERTFENLGYTREEFEKLKISDFEVIESTEDVAKHINKIIREGSDAFETKHRRKDGEIRNVFANSRAISIGERDFIQSICRDITERKKTEEAVSYQAKLLQNVSDAIIATDLELRITSWNKAAEQIYGWKEDDVIGKIIDDVCKTEFLSKIQGEAQKQLLDEGYWQGEVLQKRKDDKALHMMAAVSWIKNNNGNAIGGVTVNRDITERKRVEDLLKKSEQSLVKAQEIGRIGSWEWDIKTDKGIWSEQIDHMFGLEPGETDISFEFLLKRTHPDDTERVKKEIERAVNEKGTIDMEYRVFRKNGNECTVHSRGEVRLDETGKPIGMVGILQDITERKQAEEMLRERQHLNELLLDSIPHSAMLISKDKKILAANRIAREVGAKAGGYCWQDFMRGEFIPEQDKKYIKDHKKVPPGGSQCYFCLADKALKSQEQANDPEVKAWNKIWDTYWIPLNKGEMQQVFLNMVTNALDSMLPKGGRLGIKVWQEKSHIKVSFNDTGEGIRKEDLGRVFEAFYTTKGALGGDTKVAGTGLGLYVSYGIMNRHRGTIEVESKKGKGATFTVSLPIKK